MLLGKHQNLVILSEVERSMWNLSALFHSKQLHTLRQYHNDLRCDYWLKPISVEPLIGPIDILPLVNIQWVIVGGESGPKARPVKAE